MSSFTLSTSGFEQLATELSVRGRSTNETAYAVRRFLQIESSFATWDQFEAAARKAVQELFDANHAAVNWRYYETTPPPALNIRFGFPEWTNYELFKALQCLLYQMNEGDIYESPIWQRLNTLCNDIATALISDHPEYQKAPWGFPEAK